MLAASNAEPRVHDIRKFQDQTTGEIVTMRCYPDGIWLEVNRKPSRIAKAMNRHGENCNSRRGSQYLCNCRPE